MDVWQELAREGRVVNCRHVVGALLVGIANCAYSAGGIGDWQLSGFGTFAAAIADDDSVVLTRGGLNKPGRERVDVGSDSIIGLQINAPVSPRSDFTLQLRAGEDDKGHFEPKVGWAFFRYTWSPSLSMRVGRLRVPFFMLSDSLQVNYSNPWIRPPVEVYGLNPFNDLDGGDLLYRAEISGAEIEVRPYFGGGWVEFSGDGDARLLAAKGINLAITYGHLSLHLGHGEGRFALQWRDEQFRQLDAGLRTFGYGNAAREMSGNDGYIRFDSFGVQWDDGNWLASAEYMRRRPNRYIASNHAWFASLGYRFGDWTPYITVARQTLDDPIVKTDVAPLPLAEGVRAFNASRNPAQHSSAIGIRWDVTRSTAIKSELAKVGVDRNAWGNSFPKDLDPFALSGKRFYVFSLSVDWVF